MFVDLGIEDRAMWGSDYPHIEGTWPWTLQSLHATFDGIDPNRSARCSPRMQPRLTVSTSKLLRRVADRIGPTLDEVRNPPAEPAPELRYSLGFRSSGAWS